MLSCEQVRTILQRLFSVVKHYTKVMLELSFRTEQSLTEDYCVFRRPVGCFDEYPHTIQHDAYRESIVCSARTGDSAIEVSIYEKRMFFSFLCAVGYSDNDVAQFDVGLVQSLAHQVKSLIKVSICNSSNEHAATDL